ncbi:hypothetical protein MKX03_017240 [Papaver bracteatum]|nr:hypothetical protein MKX03_017240 [Papaver bracteatum]
MKLITQHQNFFNFSAMRILLCSLTLIISCMSMNVNCYAVTNDANKSSDRLALIAIKNGITDDPSAVLSSWNNENNSLHFCEWRGVTCSRRNPSKVVGIDLNSHRLVGSVSPYIGNLSFLKDLILSNNSLTGEIPPQIGRLFRLKHLGLSNNSLEGEIPQNISRCSNLVHLNISGNNLVGSIPNGLGYLSNLKMMFLRNNNLSGEIPTSLGNLSSLTHLTLGFNNLEGTIPSSLCQLTSLKMLGLDSNKLSGTVPSLLYNISSLEVFSLMINQLHGSIPFYIGSTLPNLKHFSIAENNFAGSIPSSVSNLSRLETLQIDSNNLVGSVPYNLGNLKNMIRLILDHNNLGTGQADDLKFLNSIINCTSLKTLYLSVNNFGGELPISIANFSTNLGNLNFYDNQIYGSIPPGIENLQGLTTLYLGSNQLTGSIPPGIGFLRNLRLLGLEENKLFDSIPSSFENLRQLIELDLSENKLTGLIPSSLGNCNSLQLLDLHTNRLSGSIPKQIFELPSLSRFLNLANNTLTGSLPIEVGNLKDIGFLALSGNELSGEIPSTIGECLSLRYLHLDSNFFQGNIPPAITFLKGLESLKLSRNNLSGIIPEGLQNLTTLTDLDLSYNNLEGAVPKEGVFESANLSYNNLEGAISSFGITVEGNSKLCGGIPALKLQSCSVLLLNANTKQKHKKSMPTKVVLIIVLFLFLSLILIVAILYWRKQLKTKLPSTALNMGDRLKGVSYNELHKATNGFNDSTNLLGVGSFGSVYKGILREDGSKLVAVKVLHLQQKGATKSFMAECDALRKVRHRNLLKIVTCCSSVDFQGNEFKALVFEYMANGTLENWLHPAEDDTSNDDQLHLNLERRFNVAVDVASALNYLHHDCKSPIVHCDLKPSNILLDDDLIAHVGDFGLAKFLQHTCSTSRHLNEQDASSIAIKGSIGYVAPEYGMGGEVSTLGDVYSYGILLLEMFTGKRPTDGMFKDGLNLHKFSKMHAFPERVLDIVDSRLLLELEGEDLHNDETNNYSMPQTERTNRATHTKRQILTSIIQIGVICSSELPSNRINMNKVIVDMQAVKNRFLEIGVQ